MWYYIANGQQQGPLDDSGLKDSVGKGVITPETMVWKEGQPDWAPLKQISTTFLPPFPSDPSAICSICNKAVGADNLIELVGVQVCAACKPKALQTIREGAPLTGSNTAWSDGKKVVVRDETHLPPRCVKCNAATAEQPLKRKLYWHPPAYYLLIFISLLVYVIVAIIVRKKGSVHVSLCSEHLRRRKYFMIGGWVGSFVALAIAFTGMVLNTSWLTATGFILLPVAIITGLVGARVTPAARIKDKTIWLRGASKEFLASLPQWPGR